jgi:hypothetical protein
MALQFNSYSKTGLISALRAMNTSGLFGTSATLRLFPDTVAFPSSPVNTTGATPAGHIVSYTGLTFTLVGNTIRVTAGTTTANTTAAGNFAWWALVGTSSGHGSIISDSISLSGGGGIVTVNDMTATSGQSISVTFNLTMGA